MKILSLLIFLLIGMYATDVKKDLITSRYDCHVTVEKKGRCTGSAYCTACRNCSRCAYCSNGGSCGVCGGGSNYYSAPKKAKRSSSTSSYYSTYKVSRNYYENETIVIYNETINLRKGPGLEYAIIEKLYSGDSVTFLEKDGEWLKVTVENTETTGYIYAKLLK